VARNLFRQILDRHPSAPAGRLSALPLSVAVHALAVAIAVVIPLVAPEVLPLVQGSDISWTPVVLPSSPPPILRHRSAVPARRRQAGPVPTEPPKGVSSERLIVPDRPPDPDLPVGGDVVVGTGVPGGTGGVVPDAPPPARPVSPVPASMLVTPPVKIVDARRCRGAARREAGS
jgi:hypothetical protein